MLQSMRLQRVGHNLATEQQQLEPTTPRMNHMVNCGPWVIVMCQCKFIFGK